MIHTSLFLDGDGAFEDIAGKIKHKGQILRIAALEGGMSSGKPSVMFAIELEDGSIVAAQTSMVMLYSWVVAFRARYGNLDVL